VNERKREKRVRKKITDRNIEKKKKEQGRDIERE
jgi:hypothetical protein